MEVLAEQAELPKLIGDVLADVGDDSIGTDDDFVLNVFLVLFSSLVASGCALSAGMIQQPAILPVFAR